MKGREFEIFVEGEPVPEGSMKAFPYLRKNGGMGVSMVHQNPTLQSWRDSISKAFLDKYGEPPDGGWIGRHIPVSVDVGFYMSRPKTSKLDRPSSKKSDIDKLCRAVNDAMSGIVYYDDCQIVSLQAEKFFADSIVNPGVHILVKEIQ